VSVPDLLLLAGGLAGATLAPLTLVAGALWYGEQKRRAWRQRLGQVADALGGTVDDGTWRRAPRLTGILEGHPFVVDVFARSAGRATTLHSRVRVPLDLHGVHLGRGGPGPRRTVGDPAFDQLVSVHGDPVRASALLDHETRARVVGWLAEGVSVDAEGVTFEQPGYVASAEELERRVREVVAAARSLDHPLTAAAAWRVATTDPVPGVRRRATQHLLDHLERGHPDHGLLEALAHHLTEPADRLRVARLRRDTTTLRELVSSPGVEVARAAAVALARAAPGADRHLEVALLGWLGEGRADVVEALGAVGSVASVRRLRSLADRVLVVDGSAAAAREAIRAIQARAGGEAGALAVADASGGELSAPVEDRRGALADRRQPQ
jgi:hypothetical protein